MKCPKNNSFHALCLKETENERSEAELFGGERWTLHPNFFPLEVWSMLGITILRDVISFQRLFVTFLPVQEKLAKLQVLLWTTLLIALIAFRLVCIFSDFSLLYSRTLKIMWYWSSMSFVLEWKAAFFAKWIALLLSLYNMKSCCLLPNLDNNWCNHNISLAPLMIAIYFASVVKKPPPFAT